MKKVLLASVLSLFVIGAVAQADDSTGGNAGAAGGDTAQSQPKAHKGGKGKHKGKHKKNSDGGEGAGAAGGQ